MFESEEWSVYVGVQYGAKSGWWIGQMIWLCEKGYTGSGCRNVGDWNESV